MILFIALMFLLVILLRFKVIGLLPACIMIAAATLGYRLLHMSVNETGPDVSIWLASARTIVTLPDSIWSLLTTNEGRPLTVLPLVLLHLLGMPLTYVWADITGIIMYCLSFAMFAFIAKKYLPDYLAFIISLPLFASLTFASVIDYTSYNSEAPSFVVIMASMLLLNRLYRKQQLSFWLAALLGLRLGLLPFFKFQNVPAGLVIGLTAVFIFIRNKQWKSLAACLLVSLIPLVVVTAFFAYRGMLDDFINDYFKNYFYYSYMPEYAGDALAQRFHLRRIVSFIFRTPDSRWMFAGSILLFVLLWWKKKKISKESPLFWFTAIYLFANFYAVIQSGWNSPHYLLYLWIPLALFAAALFYRMQDFNANAMLAGAFLVIAAASFQGAFSHLHRKPENIAFRKPDAQIVEQIRNLTTPQDAIVVWGHADRYYVMSERPMGIRLANSWWIIGKGPLQPKRVSEFLYDIEKNKPVIIVDNTSGPDPHNFEYPQSHIKSIPAIAEYVSSHYQPITSINGAVFYKRL